MEEARKHLEKLPHSVLDTALERLENTKKRLVPPDKFTDSAFEAVDKEIWRLRVDTLGEERAKILSVEDGKRSPVELY